MRIARVVLVLGSLAILAILCSVKRYDSPPINIEAEVHAPSREAQVRRSCSIIQLERLGVPVFRNLPVIEDVQHAKFRSKEEIAGRAIAVLLTALKGEGLSQDAINSATEDYQAARFFSPKEAAFIRDPHPSEDALTQAIWRYESCHVLLWALGYIERLDPPQTSCDVKPLVSSIRGRTYEGLIKDARLRSKTAILDEADLIYRHHWAIVDARVHNRQPPANLDADVIQERHYTLNWLIGYLDQTWDEISTDT